MMKHDETIVLIDFDESDWQRNPQIVLWAQVTGLMGSPWRSVFSSQGMLKLCTCVTCDIFHRYSQVILVTST